MNKTSFKKGHKPWNKGKKGYNKGHKPYFVKYGSQNPAWKGGKTITTHGYVDIRIDGKYVKEHRHVMKQHLKRKLKDTEHVHHINGDITDNRIENLEVIDQGTHSKKHYKNNPIKKLQFKKGSPPPPHKPGCKCFRCAPYKARIWEKTKKHNTKNN